MLANGYRRYSVLRDVTKFRKANIGKTVNLNLLVLSVREIFIFYRRKYKENLFHAE